MGILQNLFGRRHQRRHDGAARAFANAGRYPHAQNTNGGGVQSGPAVPLHH